jgi:hypothetical protein
MYATRRSLQIDVVLKMIERAEGENDVELLVARWRKVACVRDQRSERCAGGLRPIAGVGNEPFRVRLRVPSVTVQNV